MVLASSNAFQQASQGSADVCVIGGGIAGITIALALARRRLRVLLLEAGGETYSRRSQDLYRGEAWDDRYSLTGTRARMLGGSSNCWGGWTRPPCSSDFARRPWVGAPGWPIGWRDLAPYHAEASRLLQLSEPASDAALADALDPDLGRTAGLGGDDLRTVFFHMSPPTAFGSVYRDELARAETLTVLTDATVTRIETDAASDRVLAVEVLTERGTFQVTAETFVLATGGVENPRMLLASGGVGNGGDLVGRYFMDHPRIRLRHLLLQGGDRISQLFDARHYGGGSMLRGRGRVGCALSPSPEEQRRAEVLQSYTGLVACFFGQTDATLEDARQVYKATRGRPHEPITAARAARALAGTPQALAYLLARRLDLRGRRMRFEVETVVEPMPDRDNRVELTGEKDRNGVPKARVTWRRHDVERRTHRHAFDLVQKAMEAEGQGRMTVDPGIWDPERWDANVMTTWHHMGTTRMAAAPSEGVVDTDCRVFGTSNLYVAGSSVFATGGGMPPTLLVTLLALRLADHLAARAAMPLVAAAE